MNDYLTKLRGHPDHKKKRIALITSSAIMAVIVIIWVATFPARISQTASVGSNPALQPVKDQLNSSANVLPPTQNNSAQLNNIPVKEYTSNGVTITDPQ